jgi:hypothetical protein
MATVADPEGAQPRRVGFGPTADGTIDSWLHQISTTEPTPQEVFQKGWNAGLTLDADQFWAAIEDLHPSAVFLVTLDGNPHFLVAPTLVPPTANSPTYEGKILALGAQTPRVANIKPPLFLVPDPEQSFRSQVAVFGVGPSRHL